MYKLIKVCAWFHVPYFILILLYRRNESFEQKAYFYVLFGSLTASFVLCALLMRFRLFFADYVFLILIGTRCIAVFMLLKLMNDGVDGFQLIDRKTLDDAIPFVAGPSFCLACCNWRFNMFVSFPLTFLAIQLVTW